MADPKRNWVADMIASMSDAGREEFLAQLKAELARLKVLKPATPCARCARRDALVGTLPPMTTEMESSLKAIRNRRRAKRDAK